MLLVDDHALFREGLALILASVDPAVMVLHAGSIEQALLALAHAPHLVLLDLALPGMGGVDALRRLRQQPDAPPVVIVSGSEAPAVIRDCIAAGAMGYIPKSSTSRVLAEALRQVFAGSVWLPPLAEVDATPRAAASCAELGLTPRQLEVLGALVQGKTNKAIARDLGINEATVKSHVSAVLQALGASNRTEAVYAVRHLRIR